MIFLFYFFFFICSPLSSFLVFPSFLLVFRLCRAWLERGWYVGVVRSTPFSRFSLPQTMSQAGSVGTERAPFRTLVWTSVTVQDVCIHGVNVGFRIFVLFIFVRVSQARRRAAAEEMREELAHREGAQFGVSQTAVTAGDQQWNNSLDITIDAFSISAHDKTLFKDSSLQV